MVGVGGRVEMIKVFFLFTLRPECREKRSITGSARSKAEKRLDDSARSSANAYFLGERTGVGLCGAGGGDKTGEGAHLERKKSKTSKHRTNSKGETLLHFP